MDIIYGLAIIGGVFLVISWIVLPFSIQNINKNLKAVIKLLEKLNDKDKT